jgi:hypothetical protein
MLNINIISRPKINALLNGALGFPVGSVLSVENTG